MKCQIPFTGKNKKNIINLSSAENAQRVVKVNKCLCHTIVIINQKYFFVVSKRILYNMGDQVPNIYCKQF